ncbi:SUPPRESSOR OF GAMMA RESPONSE 1-like [Mercurialis annua]|uniref:SUPPRESSOR OF GAMMA RESPONSE 1-like n=1 Tax=Mercurialis annua TaxID=3986 RepID=UPI00215FFE6A|nr:SUPPRESSOR OF GAMMA RESPONSE 1-like [Mercurialis annua]
MARAWLIDSRTIARKVKNPARACAYQIKDYGANRDCPNCHHRIDNSDVSHDWPGLPAGVKFDPSDAELLEHLAAKCGIGASKPHAFIDEFIPTLVDDKGICYAHPEKLPGAKKDGSSVHFFHRTINAYATGQRKRRKVHNEDGSSEEHVRWHKTGKTKPVTENGMQKGCKKIMVLYKSSKKGTKPDKSNWVMHQYHLGTDEDEKEGEYVVSKIIYQQQKQMDNNDDITLVEDCDILALQTSPRTPNPNPPNPPRPGTSRICYDCADNILQSSFQEEKVIIKGEYVPVDAVQSEVYAAQPELDAAQPEDDVGYPEWLAGESQAVENTDFCGIDDPLLCKEILGSSSLFFNNSGQNNASYTSIAHTNEVTGINNAPCGIAELANLDLDTPPDFSLADLQFSSQDSIFGWLDRL